MDLNNTILKYKSFHPVIDFHMYSPGLENKYGKS